MGATAFQLQAVFLGQLRHFSSARADQLQGTGYCWQRQARGSTLLVHPVAKDKNRSGQGCSSTGHSPRDGTSLLTTAEASRHKTDVHRHHCGFVCPAGSQGSSPNNEDTSVSSQQTTLCFGNPWNRGLSSISSMMGFHSTVLTSQGLLETLFVNPQFVHRWLSPKARLWMWQTFGQVHLLPCHICTAQAPSVQSDLAKVSFSMCRSSLMARSKVTNPWNQRDKHNKQKNEGKRWLKSTTNIIRTTEAFHSSEIRRNYICISIFYSLYRAHFVNAGNSVFQSLLAHLAIIQDKGHNSQEGWSEIIPLCAVGPAGTLPPHWSAFSCWSHFIQKTQVKPGSQRWGWAERRGQTQSESVQPQYLKQCS